MDAAQQYHKALEELRLAEDEVDRLQCRLSQAEDDMSNGTDEDGETDEDILIERCWELDAELEEARRDYRKADRNVYLLEQEPEIQEIMEAEHEAEREKRQQSYLLESKYGNTLPVSIVDFWAR